MIYATTMIYVHHLPPQHYAADRLSARLSWASTAAGALDRVVRATDREPAV